MEDEKSQTFRKRRLSLSKHNLASSSNNSTHQVEETAEAAEAAAAVAEAAEAVAEAAPQETESATATAAEKESTAAADGAPTATATESSLDYGYNDTTTNISTAAPQLEADAAEADAADSKAHTFRKRRLSLTHRIDTAGDNDSATSHASSSHNNNNNQNRRNRRFSEASASSYGSTSAIRHPHLQSKILHAGELFHDNDDGGHPPSPAIHNSILYHRYRLQQQQQQQQHPPGLPSLVVAPPPLFVPDAAGESSAAAATTGTGTGGGVIVQVQPRWKRRHVSKEHSKLPFPRDIVGIYSCHGMEPVYESDYEEEEEGEAAQEVVEEEEDTWLEEDDDNDDDKKQQQQQQEKDHAAPGSQLQVDRAPSHATSNTNPPPGGALVGGDAAPNSDANANAPLPHLLDSHPLQQLLQHHRSVAKINQDRGGVAFPYGNCPKTALFAVYDGHGQGGELVSQFALHEIQRRLERHKDFPSEKAFVETFRSVDEALKQEPLIEPRFAGSTACVVLLKDQTLTIANAGDSRAVVARRKQPRQRQQRSSSDDGDGDDDASDYEYTAIPLTEDQNPDLPQEFARITSAGGYVTAPPAPGLSARVWLDSSCTQIGLAMSRSIGDHSVSVVGVIADPVVTTYQMDDQDDFLILASDGVWEFLESQDAVDVVAQSLYKNRNNKNSNRGATKACQALIEAAAAKWHIEEGEYRDDITAIVVRLQKLWTCDNAAAADTVSKEATTDANRVNKPNEAAEGQPS